MSNQPTLNQYVRRIALALDQRVSRTRVPKQARYRISDILYRAGRGEDLDLAREVTDAARTIEPESERAYYSALFLLEYSWRLVPGSPHARELLRLFRWYYDACHDVDLDLWLCLRTELVERQWSSFRLVREVAATAQGNEPPTADEVGMLADDLAPHESRYRMAERVLRNMQKEHLPAFFEYLRRLHVAASRTPPDLIAQDGMEGLLHMLGQLSSNQVVFDGLFMAYIKLAEEKDLSGRLQHILASHAHHNSIPGLVGYARKDPNKVRPIARILEHMLVHTLNEVAGTGLVELIEFAGPNDRYRLVDLFVNAGIELARKQSTPQAVIELFRQTAEKHHNTPGLAQMAADLEKITWGKELSPQDVIDYLERKANCLPLAVIRSCGRLGLDIISLYARDPSRPMQVRLRAIHTASELKAKFLLPRVQELMWELYEDDISIDQQIKAAALDGMAVTKRFISEQEKQRLYADYRTAKPVLKSTFDRNLAWYFGSTFLKETPIQHDGS